MPGPNTYDPKIHPTKNFNGNTVFGNETRPTMNSQALGPGPGSYPLKESLDHKGTKFGSGRHEPEDPMSDVPGPGNYQIPSNFDSNNQKGKTMGIKLDGPKNLVDSPAPGTYDPNIDPVRRRALDAKIGSSLRGEYKNNENPAPGYYEVRGGPEGPHWGTGTGNRAEMFHDVKTPGPGTYDMAQESQRNF